MTQFINRFSWCNEYNTIAQFVLNKFNNMNIFMEVAKKNIDLLVVLSLNARNPYPFFYIFSSFSLLLWVFHCLPLIYTKITVSQCFSLFFTVCHCFLYYCEYFTCFPLFCCFVLFYWWLWLFYCFSLIYTTIIWNISNYTKINNIIHISLKVIEFIQHHAFLLKL